MILFQSVFQRLVLYPPPTFPWLAQDVILGLYLPHQSQVLSFFVTVPPHSLPYSISGICPYLKSPENIALPLGSDVLTGKPFLTLLIFHVLPLSALQALSQHCLLVCLLSCQIALRAFIFRFIHWYIHVL